METTLPNIINTRCRQKRDLESTMNKLKQNITSLPSKRGTRVKNKPRNLPKKALPLRIESCLSFGEFYPDKLKRKRSEKVVLKPKHDYKVIVSTNKRKRSTPHRGLISFDDELPTILSELSYADKKSNALTKPLENKKSATKKKTCKSLLNVHAPRSLDIVNYKLISPPHKSLTELTIEDLMRMDDDSLSDEDMMEILTCPSPVWWEEPREDYKEGALCLFEDEARNNSRVNTSVEKLGGTNKNLFYASSASLEINLKRTNEDPVGRMRTRSKKIAKLENVLGYIKSKMRNDVNDSHKYNDERREINYNSNYFGNNEENDANDEDNKEIKKIDDNKANKRKNSVDGLKATKPRKLSSSCSDNSVNEDDLLKNLESIDIPIQKTENIIMELIIDTKSSDKNNKNKEHDAADIDKVFGKNAGKGKFVQEYQDIYNSPKKPAKQRKRGKSAKSRLNQLVNTDYPKETKNNAGESKRMKKVVKKGTPSKSTSKNEAQDTRVYTDILKRLKPQKDDILDVRLIKTPTDTNEIKVWSRLDNFKRHSYKPEYFNDVIDIEDELAFSMIISPCRNQDPLDISVPKTETILIEDDDSDNDTINKDNIDKVTIVEAIETINEVPVNSLKTAHPDVNVINVNDENIIKEDTIKIGNNIDVRLIETSPETNKTKSNRKKEVNMDVNNSLINYTIARGHGKIGLLKQLPSSLSDTDEKSLTARIYTKHKVTLIKKPEVNNDCEGINDTENTHLSHNKADVIVKKLPTLIQNPTLDSPKSTNSFISVASESASIESSEGTISDTNIKFIDDYEAKVEYIDEESQSSQIDDTREKESVADTDGDTMSLDDDNTSQIERNTDPLIFDNIEKTAENTITENIDLCFNVNPDKDNINQMAEAVVCHTETSKKFAEGDTVQEDSCIEVKEDHPADIVDENQLKTVIRTYSKKAVAKNDLKL